MVTSRSLESQGVGLADRLGHYLTTKLGSSGLSNDVEMFPTINGILTGFRIKKRGIYLHIPASNRIIRGLSDSDSPHGEDSPERQYCQFIMLSRDHH